ncbi:uncharacterized protein BDCG_16253 [Blastomyces dermatitidis ER-3]|uniref:Uncharacterized protein n=1 Tax=Ajellomyces dermatitidis (strain ER-3 / ATCC MYA-2586) TaxID=559297 RepID=A0ABX2VR04_AJEDR|nr:uncharacterized protein BDCG_16253 [Blastomyces dermatitidis ER-3]OAS99675.1 hypothetical protein BDCG_16253 [Blastomyces dermatitidis ER-3]
MASPHCIPFNGPNHRPSHDGTNLPSALPAAWPCCGFVAPPPVPTHSLPSPDPNDEVLSAQDLTELDDSLSS